MSSQSYYTAESGVEDILVRIKKSLPYSSSYSLDVGEGSTAVDIETDLIDPNKRHIISEGDVENRIRKLDVTARISSEEIGFHYAILSGDGGFQLRNNAVIQGNVYSNQNITGQNQINSVITGDAWAVGTVSTAKVEIDSHANAFEGCNILGDAYYENGNIVDTTVGGTEYPDSPPVPVVPLPDIDYDYWRGRAASGGTITGDYTINSDTNLGPKKIDGDLTINNLVTVTLTGTVWVTGELSIKENAIVRLDSTFGGNSSLIISDNKTDVENNVQLLGSGESGSYLLFISTDTSLDPADPALKVSNNAEAAVFYAPFGVLRVNQNIQVKAVTGKAIYVDNGAEVIYESGLADAVFTSGPGGGWEIIDWRDVE
jgi:hypothetical protein